MKLVPTTLTCTPFARDFGGDVASEHRRAGAGGGVERCTGRRACSGHARHQQHLPVLLLDHDGNDGTQEVIRRFEATLHDLVQVVDARLQEPAGDDAPGSRGRGIDAPEPFDGGGHDPLRRFGVADVAHAGDGLDLRAHGGELVDEIGVRVAEHEVVILGRERGRDAGRRRSSRR